MDFITLDGVQLPVSKLPAITRQVNDIAELKDRQADRSTSFTVPATHEANEFFKARQVGATDAKMYRYFTASAPTLGLSQAVATLRRVTPQGYELTLYGGIQNFFREIQNKSLQDLRLPDLDHRWSLTDIVAGLNRTDGYCYALMDYGTMPTQASPGDVFFDNFRPLIYAKRVLAQIAADAGWSIDGRVFESEEFSRLTIPWANDTWANGARFAENNGINLRQAAGVATLSGSDPGGGAVTQKPVGIPFSSFTNGGGTIELTVTGSITITDWSLSPAVGAALQFVRNGTPDAFDIDTILGVGSYSVTITTILNPGDTLELAVVYGQPAGTNLAFTYSFDYTGGAVLTDFLDAEIRYDGVVHCEAMLPDLTQTEFIKALCQMYTLTIQADPTTKVLSFRTWDDIAERRDGSLDWTDKLDTVPSTGYTELNKAFGDYAQLNYLTYAEDEAVTTDPDGELEVQDTTLKPRATMFEVAFSGSNDVSVAVGGGTQQVAQVKKIEVNQPVVGSQEYTDVQPRILAVEPSAFPPFTIDTGNLDGATQAIPVGDYNRAYFSSGAYSLRFNALKERHFSRLESSTLNPIKQVKAQVFLHPAEVLNFDFFKPVYLAQFGLYFYVLNISNYLGHEKLTEVNLLKL